MQTDEPMAWAELPAWVLWIAVDDDGCVLGFREMPTFSDGMWRVDGRDAMGTAYLGPVLPKTLSSAQQWRGEGNGQLWLLEGIGAEDAAADAPIPPALTAVLWVAAVAVILVFTGAGDWVWAWLQGVLA